MLSTWKESYNNSVLAEKSIKNINKELLNNREKVCKLLLSHKEYLITVDKLILGKEDSIEATEQTMNLKFELIKSSSWETSKITRAVAYMNPDLVAEISGIYEYQKYYDNLIKVFSQKRMTSIPETNDKVFLKKMKYFVSLIIEIEKKLVTYYNNLSKYILNPENDNV